MLRVWVIILLGLYYFRSCRAASWHWGVEYLGVGQESSVGWRQDSRSQLQRLVYTSTAHGRHLQLVCLCRIGLCGSCRLSAVALYVKPRSTTVDTRPQKVLAYLYIPNHGLLAWTSSQLPSSRPYLPPKRDRNTLIRDTWGSALGCRFLSPYSPLYYCPTYYVPLSLQVGGSPTPQSKPELRSQSSRMPTFPLG